MLVWLGLGQGTPWGRVGSYRCTCESMIGKDVRWALAFAKTLAAATLRKVLRCIIRSPLQNRLHTRGTQARSSPYACVTPLAVPALVAIDGAKRPHYVFAETPKTFSHQIRASFLLSRSVRVILVSFMGSVSSTRTPSNCIFLK